MNRPYLFSFACRDINCSFRFMQSCGMPPNGCALALRGPGSGMTARRKPESPAARGSAQRDVLSFSSLVVSRSLTNQEKIMKIRPMAIETSKRPNCRRRNNCPSTSVGKNASKTILCLPFIFLRLIVPSYFCCTPLFLPNAPTQAQPPS